MIRRALLTCLAVLAAACAGNPPEADAIEPIQDPIAAAIVRSDGFLVPFAVFENGGWHGPDAGTGDTVTGLSSAWFAGRLEVLREWRLTSPLGLADLKGDPIALGAAGAPADTGSHCERVWALPTDLPGHAAPSGRGPQIVGAAFSRAVTAMPVAELGPTAAELDRALAFLQPHFDDAEIREARRRAGDTRYEPRTTGAPAAKRPLSLSRIFRVGGREGQSIYQFEAVRTYARPAGHADARCDEASVMTGWFVEDPSGAFRLLAADLTMTDCDRKGSPLIQPLATVMLGDRSSAEAERLFVVTLERHYEGETYSITEISPSAVTTILTVHGGGC